MSNKPSFQRAKREQKAEPIVFEVDGVELAIHPKLSTAALENLGRAAELSGDESNESNAEATSAMFRFLHAQFATEKDYKRFHALDLDIETELSAFVEFVMTFYGEPGKSNGSPEPSSSTGTSSKQTVSATTG